MFVEIKPDSRAAEDHMTMIGQSHDRVRANFQDPRLKYAA